jgi:hypothetical protein
VGQVKEELHRSEWQDALDLLTKEHDGDDVTIELLAVDFGDQHEAEKLPFAYLEYDRKDDAVIVAVGGRSNRYPVVLRHIIEHPQRIFVHPPTPNAVQAVDIEAFDGSQTIVTLRPRPALPPAD